MKNFVSLLLATIIVGFIFFAILHWIFNNDINDSVLGAMCGVIGGLAVEWLKPYFIRKNKSIQKPVT